MLPTPVPPPPRKARRKQRGPSAGTLFLAAFVVCAVGGWGLLLHSIGRLTDQQNRSREAVKLQAAPARGDGDGGAEEEKQCGALVYIHVPKTGGTTLNDIFSKQPGWTFYRVRDRGTWREMVGALVEDGRAPPTGPEGERPNRVILELHTGMSPTFMQAIPGLEKLRDGFAGRRGCALTVFTMLRDPTTAAVSSYQYACKPLYLHDRRSCPGILPGLSKWSFLQGLRSDLQSSFLMSGWGGEWKPTPPPSREEIDTLRTTLKEHVDLVGVMEDFDGSVRALAKVAGLATVPYRALNVGAGKKKKGGGDSGRGWLSWLYAGAFDAEDLTEEERDTVARSQHQDMLVYQEYLAIHSARGAATGGGGGDGGGL